MKPMTKDTIGKFEASTKRQWKTEAGISYVLNRNSEAMTHGPKGRVSRTSDTSQTSNVLSAIGHYSGTETSGSSTIDPSPMVKDAFYFVCVTTRQYLFRVIYETPN